VQLEDAELLLLQAQWQSEQRLPVLALLRRAEQAAADARSGQTSPLLLAQTRALRLQASRSEPGRGNLEEILKRAEQAVGRARELTPQFPQVDAEDGALALVRAAHAPKKDRPALAAQAQARLAAALARDPALQREYGPLRAQAQALVPAQPADARGAKADRH
jgi:hypothetical protein